MIGASDLIPLVAPLVTFASVTFTMAVYQKMMRLADPVICCVDNRPWTHLCSIYFHTRGSVSARGCDSNYFHTRWFVETTQDPLVDLRNAYTYRYVHPEVTSHHLLTVTVVANMISLFGREERIRWINSGG